MDIILKFRHFAHIFFILSLSFTLAACVSPGSIQLMVPSLNRSNKPIVEYSLHVADITGGGTESDRADQTKTWHFVTTDKEFKEALVLTLNALNLFQSTSDPNSVLELQAKITNQYISRHRQTSTFEWRAFIGVSYEIRERQTDRILWKEAYLSEAGHVQTGAVHAVKAAREKAIRESLTCFVNRFSSQWAQIASHYEPVIPTMAYQERDLNLQSVISSPSSTQSLSPTISKNETAIEDKSSKPKGIAVLPINASQYTTTTAQYYASTKNAVIKRLSNWASDDKLLKFSFNCYAINDQAIINDNAIEALWLAKSFFSDQKDLSIDKAVEMGKSVSANFVLTCDLYVQSIKIILINVESREVFKKSYDFQASTGYSNAPKKIDEFIESHRRLLSP